MEAKIKYAEIEDFISQKFGKEVALAFVASSTVSVSTKIKVLGFAKSIGVDLCVEKVDGSNLQWYVGNRIAHSTCCCFLEEAFARQDEFYNPKLNQSSDCKLGRNRTIERSA